MSKNLFCSQDKNRIAGATLRPHVGDEVVAEVDAQLEGDVARDDGRVDGGEAVGVEGDAAEAVNTHRAELGTGHLRYFLIFSLIKNHFFAVFIKLETRTFLHQSYL